MMAIAILQRLVIVLLIATPIAAYADKETLERLFYTPEERASLDRKRQGLADVPDGKNDDAPVREPTLNGYVKRSDGRSTVWVDGSPRYIHKADGALNPSAIKTPNNVTVRPSK